MGAPITHYRAMSEYELRRECIRLARLAARLEKEKKEAVERRDHWFRQREDALDEIEELRSRA